jgi:nucleoside-diphosphate-sugar epimerase
MPSYLVTGCAGFIGARVTDHLLADGCQVTGIDDLNDAYDTSLKRWRLDQLAGKPGFSFLHVDITDSDRLSQVFTSEYDAVLNLAARAGVRDSVAMPRVFLDTNVMGTLNLLEQCKARGIRKFILASTSSLYSQSSSRPYREDASTDTPLSPYAASKKAAEALSYTYHYLHDIDVTVLRYFTVYGPAGRPDMSMFRFVQWINEGRPVTLYGDGQQSRDFTYVDDVARGTVAALKPLGFEIINIGSDRPAVLMDVLRLIEQCLGKKASLEYMPQHLADVRATWADISKARRMLDWSPSVPIEDGIDRLVRWYLDNRDWAQKVQT